MSKKKKKKTQITKMPSGMFCLHGSDTPCPVAPNIPPPGEDDSPLVKREEMPLCLGPGGIPITDEKIRFGVMLKHLMVHTLTGLKRAEALILRGPLEIDLLQFIRAHYRGENLPSDDPLGFLLTAASALEMVASPLKDEIYNFIFGEIHAKAIALGRYCGQECTVHHKRKNVCLAAKNIGHMMGWTNKDQWFTRRYGVKKMAENFGFDLENLPKFQYPRDKVDLFAHEYRMKLP